MELANNITHIIRVNFSVVQSMLFYQVTGVMLYYFPFYEVIFLCLSLVGCDFSFVSSLIYSVNKCKIK